MRSYAKLAWRNIWRNTRRTVLTILAVAFGILLIVVMRGMQYGSYAEMIATAVKRSSGHIQVHANGYWEKKTLKYAFPIADADTAAIAALPHVTHLSPKLVADALVGAGTENTTGAQVVGVIPSREQAMTVFAEKRVMEEGAFLADNDTTGALIGRTMAKNLKAKLGDELMLFTQARDGSMAAALLTVRGIFHVGEPEMDGYTVIAHLAMMQNVLAAQGRATAIAMTVDDVRNVERVVTLLKQRFVGGRPDSKWEVMSFMQLLPALMQSIAFDNASGVVFLILLIVVIAFGILNTILMSVMERFHEFGMMMALGMRTRAIAGMVFLEGLFLSFVGLVIGNLGGYAINAWWQSHPIRLEMGQEIYESYGFDPVLIAVPDLNQQFVWSAVMLGLTLLVAMWPAWTAMRFRPVEAIRQV